MSKLKAMPQELLDEIEKIKAQSAALKLIGADISVWLYPLALIEQIEKEWNRRTESKEATDD